ncbi:hypothetical protein CQA44_11265 [Helicobacter sp. MIT 14-3879]|nr:hypothetical protein CQA44_11265 [Helicobacter sp. MIT 14-3879]
MRINRDAYSGELMGALLLFVILLYPSSYAQQTISYLASRLTLWSCFKIPLHHLNRIFANGFIKNQTRIEA